MSSGDGGDRFPGGFEVAKTTADVPVVQPGIAGFDSRAFVDHDGIPGDVVARDLAAPEGAVSATVEPELDGYQVVDEKDGEAQVLADEESIGVDLQGHKVGVDSAAEVVEAESAEVAGSLAMRHVSSTLINPPKRDEAVPPGEQSAAVATDESVPLPARVDEESKSGANAKAAVPKVVPEQKPRAVPENTRPDVAAKHRADDPSPDDGDKNENEAAAEKGKAASRQPAAGGAGGAEPPEKGSTSTGADGDPNWEALIEIFRKPGETPAELPAVMTALELDRLERPDVALHLPPSLHIDPSRVQVERAQIAESLGDIGLPDGWLRVVFVGDGSEGLESSIKQRPWRRELDQPHPIALEAFRQLGMMYIDASMMLMPDGHGNMVDHRGMVISINGPAFSQVLDRFRLVRQEQVPGNPAANEEAAAVDVLDRIVKKALYEAVRFPQVKSELLHEMIMRLMRTHGVSGVKRLREQMNDEQAHLFEYVPPKHTEEN